MRTSCWLLLLHLTSDVVAWKVILVALFANKCPIKETNSGELKVPNSWLRTVCLEFEAPKGIDAQKYLSECLTENVKGYSGNGIRANNDESILRELTNFSLYNAGVFSPEQMPAILDAFSQRVASLSSNLSGGEDFMGIKSFTIAQMCGISRALWMLTSCHEGWTPLEEDKRAMLEILDLCEKGEYPQRGGFGTIAGRSKPWLRTIGNTRRMACRYSGKP